MYIVSIVLLFITNLAHQPQSAKKTSPPSHWRTNKNLSQWNIQLEAKFQAVLELEEFAKVAVYPLNFNIPKIMGWKMHDLSNLGYSSNFGGGNHIFYEKCLLHSSSLQILVEDFCSCHFWTSTGTPSVVDGIQMTLHGAAIFSYEFTYQPSLWYEICMVDMKYLFQNRNTNLWNIPRIECLGMSEKMIYNNLWLPLFRLSPSRRDVWSRAYTLLEALERLEIFKEEILGNDFWVEDFLAGPVVSRKRW